MSRGVYQQVFTDRLGRVERIINWIGGKPDLIPPTPAGVIERTGSLHFPATAISIDYERYFVRALDKAQKDLAPIFAEALAATLDAARGPIFDWMKECPGDLIREFPPVVGEGRGHVYRP